MTNLLNKKIDFQIKETDYFIIKRYIYENGYSYREYTSKIHFGSIPLMHITLGKNPETGASKTAKGIIAIGKIAMGVIAMGQASFALFSIGQLGIGIVSIAQGAFGFYSLGQLAVGINLAIGQFAIGYNAIGQVAFGKYVIGQIAFGHYQYSTKVKNLKVIEYFKSLFPIKFFLNFFN